MVMASLRQSIRLFFVATMLVLGSVLASLIISSDTASSPQTAARETNRRVSDEVADIHSTFTRVASQVRPAVVYIRTQREAGHAGDEERLGPWSFFLPEGEEPRRVSGGGSGFIIDKQGRILTNHHVIRDADRITVVMGESPDETEYEASIVGHDVYSDIAVIKIDAKGALPVVPLGDSDEMMVGDWVMAIGTPFGQLAGTVTVGVVSATGRNDLRIWGGEADYQNYIQTDASINFGNSGGPLVNMRGEAIGINTAINASGQGIGFAIPITMAKHISEQIISKGRVQYGYLGIQLQDLTRDLAQGRGLSVEKGILVNKVFQDTPAEKAGLQQGDVIVEFNNTPVSDSPRFRLMVGNTEVGKRVPVKIVRNGKTETVMVTLAEKTTPPEEIAAAPPGWLGLQVDDARSAEARERFGIARGQTGVVVVDVAAGSPAEDAGIMVGDVITEVYSHKVENLKEYAEISQRLKDRKDPIAFLVKRRGGTSTFVPVVPGK
jgi:Do/DeqQ family serine protease